MFDERRSASVFEEERKRRTAKAGGSLEPIKRRSCPPKGTFPEILSDPFSGSRERSSRKPAPGCHRSPFRRTTNRGRLSL
ncbi:hypothetical protein CEXT_379481 [Caerostris extrusa]|uniref:Uncharacterized protein n=1 Tax=Caerostris extrusa TaxID=172846 RepID=A0AAV4XIS2_CAEEX|nr:hypothetical protein CEXT_379481 [Caerostris extrusa]